MAKVAKRRCIKAVRYGFISVLSLFIVLLIGCLVPTRWSDRLQSDCNYLIYVSSVNQFHAELIRPLA
jgi:hypothetical protein